jgi:hypothetical protein
MFSSLTTAPALYKVIDIVHHTTVVSYICCGFLRVLPGTIQVAETGFRTFPNAQVLNFSKFPVVAQVEQPPETGMQDYRCPTLNAH